MSIISKGRQGRLSIAAAMALLFLPAVSHGQVGAIGAATGAGVAGENAHQGAPVLTESALVLPARGWSGSAYWALTSGSLAATGINYEYYQLFLGAFFAPTESLTIGVFSSLYNRIDVTTATQSAAESGLGDVSLYGKYRFWRSGDTRTSLAVIGSLGLPTGEENFGSQGVAPRGGAAASHRLPRASLHASAGLTVPTDSIDGDLTFTASAAGVLGLGDRVGASLELLGSFTDGENLINGGPGLRIRATDHLFLDAALLVNLSTSLVESPFDYALAIGATLGG